MLDSLIIRAADQTRVPAGSALAVDREAFSAYITREIAEHPLITVHHEEVTEIDEDHMTIVAAGPLCSENFSHYIEEKLAGEQLYFYDAAAPIVEAAHHRYE